MIYGFIVLVIIFAIAYFSLKHRLEAAEDYMGFLAEKVRKLERKTKDD